MSRDQDLYERLRDHLRAPASDTGVEVELLSRLFTPEEAEVALALDNRGKYVGSVAENCLLSGKDLAQHLEGMAEKGLIFGPEDESGERLYYNISLMRIMDDVFLQGREDDEESGRELADLFHKYFFGTYGSFLFDRPEPIFRIFALEQTLPSGAPEEHRVSEFISCSDFWAVAECSCRVQTDIREVGCGRPTDVCTFFGPYAKYLVSRGIAREISRDEAVAVQERAATENLVITANNSLDPVWICNCCDCCCILLWGINEYESDVYSSPYRATAEAAVCTGCAMCEETCQFGAVLVGADDVAVVDATRCVGCGLCVSECPDEAMKLERRPDNEVRKPHEENPYPFPAIDN